MKQALVTGSAGFVGRYMVTELERRNYQLSTLDLKNALAEDVRVALANITTRFDLVVHCAYLVGGRKAIDGSPMNLATNLSIDASLFDWAERTKQHRLLYFSSSAAYPKMLQTIEEQAILKESALNLDLSIIGVPDANYGWAKVMGEQLAKSTQELPVYVVRPFSGYAEDQDLTYPFPSFVDRAKNHEDPFSIWGNAEQVRDWIHITDVVNGALAVVDADVRKPVNLCTGIGTSMRQLAKLCTIQAGYHPSINVDENAPLGVHYRVGDSMLMRTIYNPKITIEEGVRRAFL